MKTCYLHLGMNKAGSTSIQHCFRDYRDEKVQYLRLAHLAPPYLDNGNHSHHLEMMFRRDVPAHFFSSPDAAGQKVERLRLRRDFERAVAEAKQSLVISGEVMFEWANLLTKRKLVGYLHTRFDHVQGLIYVREPVGYMASLIQQVIQTRAPAMRKGFGAFYPHYHQRLKSWAAALGKDNFEFVPFDLVAKSPNGLLLDFAARTGMDPRWVQRQNRVHNPLNTSLSAEAAAVLLRYRLAKGPRAPHGKECATDAKIVSALMSFGRNRFSLGGRSIQKILRLQRHDLRWIQRKLEQPFPVHEPTAGSEITFSTWSDFSNYGESLGPALVSWQTRAFPEIPAREGKPEEMLSRLYNALLNSPVR